MRSYESQATVMQSSELALPGVNGTAVLGRTSRAQRAWRADAETRMERPGHEHAASTHHAAGAARPHESDPASAALAQLTHGLAQALMQGVQRIAELNIDTTRTLLAQGGSAAKTRMDGAADAWRFSWRSYEICATTAATILKLCQSQARAGFDDLWRALEDGLAQMPQVDLGRLRETRLAFEAMRATYSAYFDAALATHRALLALAAGAR